MNSVPLAVPLELPTALRVGPEVLVGAVLSHVAAGFPSPAEDHAVKRVDLNDVLIKQPAATFLMRVSGPSMRDAGIDDKDVVLVDRSIKPAHGHIVVAVVDGDFTVKTLWRKGSRIRLRAANPTYPDIEPKDGQEVTVWGVVTTCIKRFV